MNIENLSRRFIFINDYDVFKNEALPYLSEHNRDAIVFIKSNKTIWTNGVEFNADHVKNYVDNVRELLTYDQSELQDLILAKLQEIRNNVSEAEEQLNADLLAAKDRLEEAYQKALELELSGYTKEAHDNLDAVIKDINDNITDLIQWKEDLNAETGIFNKIVTRDDFVNNLSSVFQLILNIFESSWSLKLENIHIDDRISSAVENKWLLFEDGYALWKQTVSSRISDIEGMFTYDNLWFIMETGLTDSIKAEVSRGVKDIDDTVTAIRSALNLTIDLNNNPSWSLIASSDGRYEDTPLSAYIAGWLSGDGSTIDISADRIRFSGNTLSLYISLWFNTNNPNDNTTVQFDGIDIQKDNDHIELKLRNSGFSGLRHYNDLNGNASTFELSTNGSGFLGKITEGRHPIEWDGDGLRINYNFLSDENGLYIDPATFGGYTISIFTAGEKSKTGIVPTLPENTWVWKNETYKQTSNGENTWIWYKSASIPGYDPNKNTLWMSLRIVKNDGSIIQGLNWQGPWCISGADGADGSPGIDGNAINYLFVHTKTNTRFEDVDNENYNNEDLAYVPNSPTSNKDEEIGPWKEDAFSEGASLTETYKFVWMCYSTTKIVDEDNEYYTNYSEPIIWARWGKDGIDGNGVEYIFTKTGSANITFSGSDNPNNWEASQEYPYQIPANSANWLQDPPQLTAQGQVAWVSMRRTDADGLWLAFSEPAIWAYYSIDGQSLYAYTLDFVKEDLVVSVNQSGFLTAIYDKNVRMQAWSPSGEQIKSLTDVINDGITTGKCFVLEIGDSSVALSQGNTNVDWKLFTTVNGNNGTSDLYGDSVHVHIITMDEYNNPTLINLSQSYIMPESILDKHIYCDVIVKIYNVADVYDSSTLDYNILGATPIYERTAELSIFGVYTGTDGQSIDLKTSTDLISISSTGVISPATVSVFCLLVSGSENKTIITSIPNGTDNPNNEGFIFKYKIGVDTDTDWYDVPNGGNITVPSDINTDKSLYVNLFYRKEETDPVKLISSRTIPVIKDGEKGNTGESILRSYIFTRCSNIAPLSPSNSLIQQESDVSGVNNNLGTFNQPIPHGKYNKVYGLDENDTLVDLEAVWSDGVPYGQKLLWESFATFYSNENGPHAEWSTPTPVVDTVDLDIEFSNVENYELIDDSWVQESVRNDHGWYDANDIGQYGSTVLWSEIIWRAERKRKNGIYEGPWSYIRIRGERGLTGESGVFLYLDNQCDIIPVDASGRISHSITLSTNVTLFDGSHPLSLNDNSLPISASSDVLDEIGSKEISYNNGKAKVEYTIPAGTTINTNNDSCNVIISVTYNNNQYNTVFSVSVAQIGNDKYTLKYNRNQFLFEKVENGDLIEYNPIYDAVEISFNHETNSGIEEVYRLPENYGLKCWYTGNEGNSITLVDLYSNTISAVGNPESASIYTLQSQSNSPIIVKVNPGTSNGNLQYEELCIELQYPGENGYRDRQTFLLLSTGLDGKGKRFILDLDNDSDGVLCDKVSNGYKVRKDTVIETNARFYDEGVLLLLSRESSYNNTIECVLPEGLALDNSEGDYFTTIGSLSDTDYRAAFRITIKEGTILSNIRNYIKFSVTNTTGTYYATLLIDAEMFAIYNIIPNVKSIVFFPEDNETQSSINCSNYTITDWQGTTNKTYSYPDSTIRMYFRYERGSVHGNWYLYSDQNEHVSNEYELAVYSIFIEDENSVNNERTTGITFAIVLYDNFDDIDNNRITIDECAETVETIPILYSIKGDPGEDGPVTEVILYSVNVLQNSVLATDEGTYGIIGIQPIKTVFSGEESTSTPIIQNLGYNITISVTQPVLYDDTSNAEYNNDGYWFKTIESSQKHLYIYANVYDGNNLVHSKEIPISLVNKNFMYYPAGHWDQNATYKIENNQVPYVFYNQLYYYLKKSFPDGTTNINPTNNEYWALVTQMSVVITEALMSDYGKVGDAVFYNEMMFSQNGIYNDLNVSYDSVIDNASSEKVASRIVTTPVIKEVVDNENISANSNYIISRPIYLRSGVTLNGTVTILGSTVSLSTESSEGDNSTGLFLKKCDSFGTLANSSGINLIENGLFKETTVLDDDWYVIYFVNRTNGTLTLSITLDVNIRNAFIPNWCVDLQTGRMSSANGNFITEPDGDVIVGQGNLTIDGSTGNVNVGRGTFVVNDNGNLNIGNGIFTIDGTNGNLNIGNNAFVVSGSDGSIHAANGNMLVSNDGSINIGNGNLTVDASTGEVTTKAKGQFTGDVRRILKYGNLPKNIWKVTENNQFYYTGTFSNSVLDEPQALHEYYGNADVDIFYISQSESDPYVYIPEPAEGVNGKVVEVYNYSNDNFEIRTSPETINTGWYIIAPAQSASNNYASGAISCTNVAYIKLCCTSFIESGSSAERYLWIVIERRANDGTLIY